MMRRTSLGLLAATLATAASVLVAAPASAAGTTLYAVPGGGDTNCSTVDPCNIYNAFTQAAAGDTIELAPGTYYSAASPLSSGLLLTSNVTVKDETSSVPILYSSAGAGVNLSSGDALSGLTLYYTGAKAGLGVPDQAVASRVEVFGNTPGLSCAVSGTLIDSLCVNTAASGTGAAGFGAANVTAAPAFRGDTFEGTGTGEAGLSYNLGTSATFNVSVTNSIIHGAGEDVLGDTTDSTATLSIALDHSDFTTTKTAGSGGTAQIDYNAGNISAAPMFVSAATGNFKEKAGSATIDKGAKDPITETDVVGLSRQIGSGADIGAFEHTIAPKLSKPKVTPSTKSAKVKLTANAEGLAGTIKFKATIVKAPAGFKGKKTLTTKAKKLAAVVKGVSVSISLKGLAAKTKYTVVVIAKNSAGSTRSKPIKITTK